ncbi:MAG: adenylate/guanylate cyclase domain-containing protein, partial [Chloroflexi bacterium]|nr:adenylate/guanylate cyclase domain-containing protein [Chloroflexota bacterium]
PASREFLESLAKNHLLIRFDKRGTGLSDRDVTDISRSARLLDLEAVVEAVGVDRFALIGESESGPTAIEYTVRNPSRVSHLILYGSFHRWSPPEDVIRPLIALIRSQWGIGSAALTSIFVPPGEPTRAAFFTELQKRAASGEMAARIFEENEGLDITHLLSEVKSPTLVVHRRDDRVVPVELAREMASLIPGARLATLEGDVHPPYWGDTRKILEVIAEFLGDEVPYSEADTVQGALKAVLFTDVEGSTALTERLGDERSRELLREHERITREALSTHGGSEVKTMGDGFMVSFGSAQKALECAISLQQAFAARNESADEPISVRIGRNAGEPIEEDGDLFGATVNLAARIAARAAGGEILVVDTVRGLCSGKGFLFSDLGETELRGFEDPVRLYEVRWREPD